MKTPTQEEVEAAFEFFNPERGFPLNADKFHRNLATLRAALEAKAHSKADCLRVAAEWLVDNQSWDGSRPILRYGPDQHNSPIQALLVEADRLKDRAAFDEAADQLTAKYGLPPSGRSDAQKTE